MKNLTVLHSYLVFLILSISINNGKRVNEPEFHNEDQIRQFLCTEYEKRATELCTQQAVAEWNSVTDLTNKTKAEKAMKATIEQYIFEREVYKWYVKDIDTTKLENLDLERQLKRMSNLGYGSLKPDMLEEITVILNQMQEIYNTAKICPYKTPNCNATTQGIPLTPDVENIMSNSGDYDELLYTWIAWRDATGAKIKKHYAFYVILSNEAATANNFSDHGEMWRSEYETEDFEALVDQLWTEVEPLYIELHTYVRHAIFDAYTKEFGEEEDDGYIPAHLLGNMWAQNWINIKNLVIPFPNATPINTYEIFEQDKMTVDKMFKLANDFYKSMGFLSMENAYDPKKGAIIERPKNKSIVCHASAWDFCNGTNFKVKMCVKKSIEDFITIHHELGHIQYYMMYKDLPITYRSGANPSFHEAIGDMMALSIINPNHLKRVGLIDKSINITNKHHINMLMELALVKVAFLPFGYLLDKWRWDIFAEKIDPDKWNDHYWEYRLKYQRVKAPIVRGSEDFDPGAKFHVGADAQYISYFIAHILQFQIHKAMCSLQCKDEEEEEPPFTYLHECDLMDNLMAGSKLKRAMRRGAGKHWTFVLKELTGQNRITTDAILEYFNPLYDFLVRANKNYLNKKAGEG